MISEERTKGSGIVSAMRMECDGSSATWCCNVLHCWLAAIDHEEACACVRVCHSGHIAFYDLSILETKKWEMVHLQRIGPNGASATEVGQQV